MRKEGDWSKAKPVHFVALYAWLHEQIYGTAPADLFMGNTTKLSIFACAKLLKDEFAGDKDELVEFMKWCWVREQKKKNRDDWRITWYRQFVARTLLTDYRVARARKVR